MEHIPVVIVVGIIIIVLCIKSIVCISKSEQLLYEYVTVKVLVSDVKCTSEIRSFLRE